MGSMKTPGVYIIEKNAFPNSVVEAATAIPAFIGYTEKAKNGDDDLKNIPWKISSMTEFIQYFGGAPDLKFTVDIKKYHYNQQNAKEEEKVTEGSMLPKPSSSVFQFDVETKEEEVFEQKDKEDNIVKKKYNIGHSFCVDGTNNYTLYYNMMLFFANGGSTCYIVSVGNYNENKEVELNKKALIGALDKLALEQEITMVVIPEAVNLDSSDDFKDVQTQMLSHCGYTMKNRFALLDIYPKSTENTRIDSQIEVFWDGIGSSFLSYGAAYFPWLNTSVVGDRDLTGDMFTWDDNVCTLIDKLPDPTLAKVINTFCSKSEELEIKKGGNIPEINKHTFRFDKINEQSVGDIYADSDTEKKTSIGKITSYKENEDDTGQVVAKTIIINWNPSFKYVEDKQAFHLALNSASYLYQQAMKALKKKLNLLPPSAAMAGIYTMVDNNRGVWKAPANVTLSYVDSLTEDIDNDQQADLNAPMNGKAINVIRPFRGEGIKVWGARTLDGNSLDWRYINVRRTLLFLEESIKNAARAFVFEPNDASTWINMKCMIENFLKSVWKRGGLAGATPEDAYEVHIGLGDTMTPNDILEGIIRITVLVAVSHPAEFIEITFQQQMQKS